MGPNQAGPQICLNCRVVFCFHKSTLFSSSSLILSVSSPICIQIRLIPPSPSCYLHVSSRGRLRNAGETGCSQPLCLLQYCTLQQLKSPIPITTPTALRHCVPGPLGGMPPKEPLKHAGSLRVCANLSTELHHFRTEYDRSERFRQVSSTFPTRQLILVKLCKKQRYQTVSAGYQFIFLALEEIIISFLEIAPPFF